MHTQKRTILLATALLSAAWLSGCGTKEKLTPQQQGNTPTAPALSPQGQTKPSLEMKVEVNREKATITFHTENFHLSPEHYSGMHVPGEGHIHLFVDGSPSRISVKENVYVLQSLSKGKHKIEATLHTNNHQPYDVKDELEFEIK